MRPLRTLDERMHRDMGMYAHMGGFGGVHAHMGAQEGGFGGPKWASRAPGFGGF